MVVARRDGYSDQPDPKYWHPGADKMRADAKTSGEGITPHHN
jgi:hypothetical protein